MSEQSPRRALIVYAHPEPTSFCGALRAAAIESLESSGWTVTVSDLYAEHFDPVAGRHDFKSLADASTFHYQREQMHAATQHAFADDLVREQARVAEAQLLVFIFPLWWGGMPAILKGWFDRVMAYGFAYVDGQRYETGYFKGRQGLIGITTGGTTERFSAAGCYGEMSQVMHGVQHCMLEYLGLDCGEPFVAYAAPRVDASVREAYLAQWRERLRALKTA